MHFVHQWRLPPANNHIFDTLNGSRVKPHEPFDQFEHLETKRGARYTTCEITALCSANAPPLLAHAILHDSRPTIRPPRTSEACRAGPHRIPLPAVQGRGQHDPPIPSGLRLSQPILMLHRIPLDPTRVSTTSATLISTYAGLTNSLGGRYWKGLDLHRQWPTTPGSPGGRSLPCVDCALGCMLPQDFKANCHFACIGSDRRSCHAWSKTSVLLAVLLPVPSIHTSNPHRKRIIWS